MARYQNISTVTTSIMKKAHTGEYRTLTVKPGQIVNIDSDDIQATMDSYNPREKNPFDIGFIAEVPEGKGSHPKAPRLSRNPTMRQAQDAIKSGDAKKIISEISDFRGLVIMRRALDAERNALTDSQFSDIDRLLDRQADKVERIQKDNAEKFGKI